MTNNMYDQQQISRIIKLDRFTHKIIGKYVNYNRLCEVALYLVKHMHDIVFHVD